MAENEKDFKVNIKCPSCQTINKVDYSTFKMAMLANHFYRYTCDNDKCKSRFLVTYKMMFVPIKSNQLPEQAFESLKIE